MREKEILTLLSFVGECYRKDLILAMNDKNTNESVVLNRLKTLGFILESEIICNEDPRKKTVKTIAITNKGRVRLSNILCNDYHHDLGSIVNKRFSSTKPSDRHTELGKSKLQLFLNQSGIKVFPQDKPSFPRLYNQAIATTYFLPNEWIYSTSPRPLESLNQGVFYSLEEFYDFFKCSPYLGEGDISYGTRIKGIYLDRTRTCVVYQPNYFKNRTINFKLETVERRTLNLVKKYTQSINHVDNIDAIVLTNGNALIVDMGISGKHGKTSQRDRQFKTVAFLNNDCDFFNNIYCFPHTIAGVYSLNYFATHDETKYREDTISLVSDLSNFTSIEKQYLGDKRLFISDLSANKRAIYIPYYNIKLLEWISLFSDTISIITYPDMADSISHIIRRETKFYDLLGNPIDVTIYEKNGLPKGVITEVKETKKTRKPNYKKVAIEFPKETVEQLRTIARYKDTSLSKIIRNLVVPYAVEEYKNYEELVELEKEKKKLMRTPYRRNIK